MVITVFIKALCLFSGTVPIDIAHKIPNIHRKVEDGGNFSLYGINTTAENPLSYSNNAEPSIHSESLLKSGTQERSSILTKPFYISRPIQLVTKFDVDNIPPKVFKNVIGHDKPSNPIPTVTMAAGASSHKAALELINLHGVLLTTESTKNKANNIKKFLDYAHLRDHFKIGKMGRIITQEKLTTVSYKENSIVLYARLNRNRAISDISYYPSPRTPFGTIF